LPKLDLEIFENRPPGFYSRPQTMTDMGWPKIHLVMRPVGYLWPLSLLIYMLDVGSQWRHWGWCHPGRQTRVSP